MKRALILAVVVLAAIAAALWYLSQRNNATHVVSGTIETDEVLVASRYGGRVEAIFAEEGDSLTNGQRIAELVASELTARREQAAAFWEQLKNGPRREEIDSAKHNWEALQAELELARSDLKRVRELFEQKTVAEAALDQASARVRTLEQNGAAAKAQYDLLLAGTRNEEINQARARLDEIDAHLREMRVVAPTNCVLEVLHVKVGDVLEPNRSLATLILPQRLWVRVYVPQTWLGYIALGESVKLRVDPFPGREFDGVVEQINREAEFTPRNVQTSEERVKQVFGVKVRIANPDGVLRAGISADVVFPGVPRPPR